MNKQKHVMMYISRHGQHNTWQVRRKIKGTDVSACFADTYYGSKSRSLVQAITWRNRVFSQ